MADSRRLRTSPWRTWTCVFPPTDLSAYSSANTVTKKSCGRSCSPFIRVLQHWHADSNGNNTNMPFNLRPDNPRRCSAIWRVPIKVADRSWPMHEQAFATFFAPVTLTLTRSPSYTNFTRILRKYTLPDVQIWPSYVKPFESYRLTYIHTDRQTVRQMSSELCTTPPRGWSINLNMERRRTTSQHWARRRCRSQAILTRSSATAESTARPSCLDGVLNDISFLGRKSVDG